MKHILGMAKSSLDLNGARRPKLELDYLRLVYAVKEIRKKGDSAQGYLVVLTPQIVDSVKGWQHKYEGDSCVSVIDLSLPGDVWKKLVKEKEDNLKGMVAGSTGGRALGRSNSDTGRETGENGLKSAILRLEPKTKQVKDESAFPFGVHWDFYGVID
jgi:hypothetical protein